MKPINNINQMKTQKSLILFLTVLAFSCHQGNDKNIEQKDTLSISANETNATSDDKSEVLNTPELSKTEERLLPILTKIVKTSPEFLKQTKGLKKGIVENGGTDWVLEYTYRTPSEKEHTELYYFGLYEIYGNRSPRIASYCFNTKTKQLYEEQLYDTDTSEFGTLKPIKFDKKLIPVLNSLLQVPN